MCLRQCCQISLDESEVVPATQVGERLSGQAEQEGVWILENLKQSVNSGWRCPLVGKSGELPYVPFETVV